MLMGFFNQGRLLYLFYLFYPSILSKHFTLPYHIIPFHSFIHSFFLLRFVMCMCAVLVCPSVLHFVFVFFIVAALWADEGSLHGRITWMGWDGMACMDGMGVDTVGTNKTLSNKGCGNE